MAPSIPDCSNRTPALRSRLRYLRRHIVVFHCVILRQQNEADQQRQARRGTGGRSGICTPGEYPGKADDRSRYDSARITARLPSNRAHRMSFGRCMYSGASSTVSPTKMAPARIIGTCALRGPCSLQTNTCQLGVSAPFFGCHGELLCADTAISKNLHHEQTPRASQNMMGTCVHANGQCFADGAKERHVQRDAMARQGRTRCSSNSI